MFGLGSDKNTGPEHVETTQLGGSSSAGELRQVHRDGAQEVVLGPKL